MMSHYCVSNIWASMGLVKAGINQPVLTMEDYLFVESWFFNTHSYVAMTHENPLCKHLSESPQAAQISHSEKNG